MNWAKISRAAGVVMDRLEDDGPQAAFWLAASQWRTLDDVPLEWRESIVRAGAELDRRDAELDRAIERARDERIDDFTSVDMLSSMGAAITMGVKKADFGKPLTPLQSEDWDELELEITEMLAAGITPEFPDDWGDSLQVPSPMPLPQPGLPPSALSSASTPPNNSEH